ncbi:protein of unknown function [Blastococcus saxobsidens DD2]|uniref:Uncharacterized protein n=1 Tax=Blastococcus saxobsidens (strain DD2) TaxID=1146883 RepID=H6RVN8_BLASD|nr:protein of unknown function [Blastococcus saxobsidens DD2]
MRFPRRPGLCSPGPSSARLPRRDGGEPASCGQAARTSVDAAGGATGSSQRISSRRRPDASTTGTHRHSGHSLPRIDLPPLVHLLFTFSLHRLVFHSTRVSVTGSLSSRDTERLTAAVAGR